MDSPIPGLRTTVNLQGCRVGMASVVAEGLKVELLNIIKQGSSLV